MHVGLLECDHVAERYRGIAGDYRDMFARWLGRAVPDLRLEPFDVCNGELPASADACDAYVCGGSRWSVFDDVDWLPPLRAFVRALHETGRPFVGICFGHQVLADALGGRVVRTDAWGVGVGQVEMARHEAWMRPPLDSYHLLTSHQDQIDRLPSEAVLLGRSDHCPIEMFRVGASMLGIQGHPEITPEYADALLVDRTERIGAARVQRARESLGTPTDADVIGQWVLGFLRHQAAARAADATTGVRPPPIDPGIM